MASKIVQAFKQKEVRNKILIALFVLLLYRVGCAIPVIGIPFNDIAGQFSGEGVLAALALFSGSAGQLTFFSLGILPYITASILVQLLSLVFPKLAQWKKEGAEGRKHIIKLTRTLTIVLGIINAIGYDLMFQSQYGIVYPGSVPPLLSNVIVVFTLLFGCICIMYMSEIGKQKSGINLMSAIVLLNICSSVPSAFVQSVQTSGDGFAGMGLTLAAIIVLVIIVPVIVEVERAQRRVPIKSTKSGANSMYARQQETNYIPVPVDVAGLYALIFAASMMMLPVYLSAWFTDVQWLQQISSVLTAGPVSWTMSFVLVVFFCFFMAGVNFDSESIADNLKKQGSFVPGVRPGNATQKYFEYIVNHITLFGAVFIGVVSLIMSILMFLTANPLLQVFGGTSIIIAVTGSIQLVSTIEQEIRSGDPEAVLRRLGR